eukprot:g50109.t1
MLSRSHEAACPSPQLDPQLGSKRHDEASAPTPPPAKKARLAAAPLILCFFSKSNAYPPESELGRLLQPLGPRGLTTCISALTRPPR